MKIILKVGINILIMFMFITVLNIGSSNVASARTIEQPTLAGENCSGGSCTSYRQDGSKRCTACCPSDKNPSCADLGGCTCE